MIKGFYEGFEKQAAKPSEILRRGWEKLIKTEGMAGIKTRAQAIKTVAPKK